MTPIFTLLHFATLEATMRLELLIAVSILNKHLPTELVAKILFYHKALSHPITLMLKQLKEVRLTTTWSHNIYEAKTTDWDGPFQSRETLHDLQLIRGRQGHKDVFKFVQDIYQPLIDMERFSMNNIETNVGALYHTEYLNTNPNVCILPQHSVIPYETKNSQLNISFIFLTVISSNGEPPQDNILKLYLYF